jgi:uncharacterized membrane protein YkoI
MNTKVLFGSTIAVAVLGLGIFAGSTLQAGSVSAQAPTASYTAPAPQYAASNAAPVAQAVAYSGARAARFAASAAAPAAPVAQTAASATPEAKGSSGTATTAITKQQAEQAALAASPGNTVDHTALTKDANGTQIWDVDFANGGGAQVDATTGKVITTEAAGADKGGARGGHGGGGANQAALAAQAKVTKQQAEQAALTASPGNTVDHSSLAKDASGTIFWDVDFTNGGGVTVNAQTGAVIATEAAGTDKGGHHGGGSTTNP